MALIWLYVCARFQYTSISLCKDPKKDIMFGWYFYLCLIWCYFKAIKYVWFVLWLMMLILCFFFPLIHIDMTTFWVGLQPSVMFFIQPFLIYIFVSLFIKSFLFVRKNEQRKKTCNNRRDRFLCCFGASVNIFKGKLWNL